MSGEDRPPTDGQEVSRGTREGLARRPDSTRPSTGSRNAVPLPEPVEGRQARQPGPRILLKALALFVIFNLLWALLQPPIGRLTLYNRLLPGRERLPFGENFQKSYNLSLYDLDAMFASQRIDAAPKAAGEYRVILIGDSSIWGTLLRPEETLAGRLNALGLTCGGKRVVAYNLGYPTISLTKDVLLLRRALAYHPDLVLWGVTLEAFPADKQLSSPLVAASLGELVEPRPSTDWQEVSRGALLERTIVGQRRALADWLRLQAAGVLWAATGIDQEYPDKYTPAQRDYDPDATFHGWSGPDFPAGGLAWDALDAGAALVRQAGARLLLLNEPMLISTGKNSDLRYNFFYPRWAYDRYRALLAERYGDRLVDAWDRIPAGEFTNSAIHLTPAGEQALAEIVADALCE